MMRREFITLLGGAAVSGAARAPDRRQPARQGPFIVSPLAQVLDWISGVHRNKKRRLMSEMGLGRVKTLEGKQ
jgi:hypothetical protein